MTESSYTEIHYTEDAKDRLRRIDKRELEAFFKQLKTRERAQSVSQLPAIKGFSKDSAAHTNQQVKVLVGQILAEKPQKAQLQRNLNAVGLAWQIAGVRFAKLDQTIANILDSWSEREDAANIEEFYENYADQLFGALRELTIKDKLTREEVQRFFDFSPFSNTKRIQSILDTCKSKEQVNRDKKLSELPRLVDEARNQIASLQAKFEDISNRDSERSEITRNLSVRSSEAIEKACRSELDISQLKISLTELQTAAEHSNHKILRKFEGQSEASALSQAKIESIQETLAATNQLLRESQERESAVREELKELSSRIEDLQLISGASRSKSSDAPQTNDHPVKARLIEAALSLRKVPKQVTGSGGQLQTASELRQALDLMGKNLKCLGIKPSSVDVLKTAVLAAFVAGQVPIFSGVHARSVAQVCALTIAGGNTYRLNIPVGIRSPNDFRECLDEMETITGLADEVCCLIIEGINRSAFDAFGENLIELIQQSRLSVGKAHRPVVMATVTSGPASLPISNSHASLGPSLHCDCVEWRAMPSVESRPVGGRILSENWHQIRSDAMNCRGFNTEEVVFLFDQVSSTPNPMLRQTVHLAYRALVSMNDAKPDEFALRHLLFGWILPIGIVQEKEATLMRNLLSEYSDRLDECADICARVVQIYEAGCY